MSRTQSRPGIKRADTFTEYTPQQLISLARSIEDPVYFLKTFAKIQHPVRGEIPFDLYPFQEEMIRTYACHRLVVTLMPRQSGKTQCAAGFLLWKGIFTADQTILIASNKNSNAKEIIQRIQYIYERLPDWIKPGVTSITKHSIEFDNGTRILSQATTENTGRGLSVSLFFCDELAFVPHGIQEEMWTSVSPTLATGGAMIIASTPNGDTDIFSQIWRGANNKASETDVAGANGFVPIVIKWNDVPGRDDSFRKRETAKIGPVKWKQEYECQFISSDPLLIDTEILSRLATKTEANIPVGKLDDVKLYELPKVGSTYVFGVDPATGSGEDYTAIVGFKFPEMRQVLEYRVNDMSPSSTFSTLKRLLAYYEREKTTVYFSIENNGVGEGMMSLLEHDESWVGTAELISEEGKNRRGMTTTAPAKLKACVTLKDMIERGQMEIKSPNLVRELKHFVRSRGSYDHQIGATSDLVSATLIAVRIINEIALFDDAAYAKLYSGTAIDDMSEVETWDDDYDPSMFMSF